MDKQQPESVENPETENPDPLETFQAALGDADGGAEIRCYKVDAETKRIAMCGKHPVSQFEPEKIAALYGSGTYEFQLISNGRIQTRKRLDMLAPPEVNQPDETTENSRIRELELRLEAERTRHQDFNQQMLLTLLQRDAPAASATSPAEILKLAQAIAPPQPLDQFREVFDFARSLQSNSEDESPMGKIAEALGKILGPAAMAAAPAAAAAMPAPDDEAALLAAMRQLAPQMLSEAQANRDPAVWAMFMFERIPEAYRDVVVNIVNLDPAKRKELVARVDERLLPYFAWIEDAVQSLSDAITGEIEDATDVSG